MDGEDKGNSFSEMEDWMEELLPDFAGDNGLGKGVTDFPSSSSFRSSSYNQQNGSVAATTSNSRMWPHHQSGFPPQVWHNQAVDHRAPPNSYQFQMPSNSYATMQAPQNTPGFHQAQNFTLADRMFPGNRPQTMRLGGLHPLPESAPPPVLPNSTDWVHEAYFKMLQSKETILTEVLNFSRRSQHLRQWATTPEAARHYERMIIFSEWVINFLHMPRDDIVRWPKEKLYYAMNDAVKYFDHARFQNAVSQRATANGVRLENAVQLNNPVRSGAPPSYQRQQQPNGFDSRALGSFLGSARVDNQSVPDPANAKRRRSLGRKKEEKKPSRFAVLNSGQSSQVNGKDLPSSSSKPATVSVSASSSAFLSPMTPCSKPSDFANSPMSVDEDSRFSPNSSDPPLMKRAGENLLVADEQRLLDTVMFMSPRALNSAVQDIYAVTSGSTGVFLGDLSDDVSKVRKQSATDDQMEPGTGFCVRGSAKRLKKEPRDFLLQEIKEINQRSMEVKVDVMNIDDVSRMGFDGDILIRCSYIPVGPASQQRAPKLLLELIVPAGYPSFSPTVCDKMHPGCCDFEDAENLWGEAKSGFSLKLRKFSEPITVKQMARAWEDSAREVFLEYAERTGGGSLLISSRCSYGNWESLAVAF